MDTIGILTSCIIALFILVIYLIAKKFQDKNTIRKVNLALGEEKSKLLNSYNESTELSREKRELLTKVKSLSKYIPIQDIEKKVAEINEEIIRKQQEADKSILEMKAEIEKQQKEAEKIISDSFDEADKKQKDIIKEAKIKASELIAKADKIIIDFENVAKQILEEARTNAKEIIGESYDQMKDVANYKKLSQAMKNVIEGYGDQYIIPTFSLLDELAEDYGHTEAGEELKKAREFTRSMVKLGKAATCDYVENYRKQTAINFVLDAFNGKVDTIFSNVKNDNYGTLSQKIKDAFILVNDNGQAFRNAVITEPYLLARINELKWAVVVQELRLQEREEQRVINERIREEEKARREYEKAIKESEKEEELLKKAIQKVQQDVDLANDEQKKFYENKLSELNLKLKEAEEKNQRALSMAQQTKTGHVYIISNIGSFGENVYKIGLTRRLEPLDRVRELGDASVPFAFDIHALIYNEDAPKLETELHKKFAKAQLNKVNPRKEFFKTSLKEIKAIVEELGIEAKWTLLAQAKEYRESLVIEKAFSEHTINSEEWAKKLIENIPNEEEELQEYKESL